LAEWHEVKLQYTAVSMLCIPLSMVGVAASMLGPACDGMGFDPRQSSCQKAAQGTNASNCREENGFLLINAIRVLGTFGECQVMAQSVARRWLVFPLINKDFRVCYHLLISDDFPSAQLTDPDHGHATGSMMPEGRQDAASDTRATRPPPARVAGPTRLADSAAQCFPRRDASGL
jgi:hypothetical protein